MKKITHDSAINLNRTAQEVFHTYFDNAQKHLLEMRATIAAQDVQIASLQSKVHLTAAYDQLEAENTELKRLNSVMFLRLEAHAKARYHGRDDAPDIRGFLAPEILVMLERDKNTRLNRIATGIKNRINDGHTALAIIMCETLMEETIDEHANDGDTGNNIGTRSNGDTKTTRSLGTPYIGD